MNKILRNREVRFDELPDGFDVSTLPEDIDIIFEESFPELEDEFWEEE